MHDDGKTSWWRNDGPSPFANIGWNWDGPISLQVGALNATQKNVHFGDINGDGTCSSPLVPNF